MIKPKTYALVVFVLVGIGGAWLLRHYKRTAREQLATPPAHSTLGPAAADSALALF
jgi:hypothetical protein